MASLSRSLLRCVVPQFARCWRQGSLTTPILVNKFTRHHLYKERWSSSIPKPQKDMVNVVFIKTDGERLSTQAKIGDNLLDVIIENDIDIDGFGACEGTLACSTCHLIFKKADFNLLPEKPTDEELDMLDLAYDLVDTSRLGCQVIVSKDMEGIEIKVPSGVSDARS